MHIMVVEDTSTIRSMLVALLDGQSGHRVVAAVETVEEAVDFLTHHHVDLVILDLCLPGLSYDLAVKAVKDACPTMDIMVFTVSDDDEIIFSALKAGAIGYLLKTAHPVEIFSALDQIKAGGSPMSPSIARKVLREFQSSQKPQELEGMLSPLSSRETEILDLLYKGLSFLQIGDKLCISPHTVHTHIKKIYTKLHVNSRSQAIYEAVQKNFIRG